MAIPNPTTDGRSAHICSQFIVESGGLPLFRSLQISGEHARRVKVRQRKNESSVTEAFNAAFVERSRNIYQRAIFATTNPEPLTSTTEPFYVFPLNGYRFMYCTEVNKTNTGFQNAIDTLMEQFGEDSENEAVSVLKELLRYSYVDSDLHEGITRGSEIIIYNTPSYVAVRCSSVEEYHDAIKLISS